MDNLNEVLGAVTASDLELMLAVEELQWLLSHPERR